MCQNSQPRNLFPDILVDTMDHTATVTFNGGLFFPHCHLFFNSLTLLSKTLPSLCFAAVTTQFSLRDQ